MMFKSSLLKFSFIYLIALCFQTTALAEVPEAPNIRRDVHLSEQGVTTRPYIPSHRTTADGRIGITRRSVSGGLMGFFLYVPEKYNSSEGATFKDNPSGLNGQNGMSILATRAGNVGDVVNGNEPVLAEYSSTVTGNNSQHAVVPQELGWINRGHQTLCDPTNAMSATELGNQRRNPYVCGDDDCYDLKVVGYAINNSTATREKKLFSTPVTIRVANPKTKQAYISEVDIHKDANGNPLTEFSDIDFDLVNLFEPQFTDDGKLLIARVGNSRIQWEQTHGSNIGSFDGGRDVVYFRNPAGVENGIACDIKNFNSVFPVSYAPADPSVNRRYGFAKYGFRDSMNNPIPEGIDIRTYPWIDKAGDNISFAMYRHSLFRRDSTGTNVSSFPARCVNNDPACIVERNGIGGGPKGQAILGLWTHGKTVLLDGLINQTDFHSGRHDYQQRELQLYKPDGNWDGWIRTGNGGSNQLSSFVPSLYPTNTGFFESNESAFHFLKHMKPTGPHEVSWIVSSGAVTEELSFDDYLNMNGFIMSNMMPATSRRGGDWVVHSAHGRSLTPSLQNHATALPTHWKIPAAGTLVNARIEPVASGGIHGRGLWLSGNNSRAEYSVPTGQPRNLNTADWNISIFLDPRYSENINDDRRARQLLSFPDGTSVWLAGRAEIQYRKDNRVITRINSSRRSPEIGWLPHWLRYKKWNHLGIQVSERGTRVRTFFDGMVSHDVKLPTGTTLFGMSEQDNGLGGGVVKLGSDEGNLGFRGWVDEFKIIAGKINVEYSCNLAHGTLKGLDHSSEAEGEGRERLSTFWDKANTYPPMMKDQINQCVASSGSLTSERYSCEVNYDSDDYPPLRSTPGMRSLRDAIHFPEGPFQADQNRPDARTNAFCTSCHSPDQPQGLSMTSLVAGNFVNQRPPSLAPHTVIGHPLTGALEIEGEQDNLQHYLTADGFSTDRLVFRDSEARTNIGNPESCFTYNSEANVNFPPVASNQTLEHIAGNRTDITLIARDANGDSLRYEFIQQAQNGSIRGTAPNITYQSNPGFSGVDTIRFRVSDGTQFSQIATITINVSAETDSNHISNFLSNGIVVDGNDRDWANLRRFSSDANDASGNIDWHDAAFAHDNQNFYLNYRNHGNIDPNSQAGNYLAWGWQVFIDVDNNSNTGFQMEAIGADYVIEGNFLQRYTGTGNNWSWSTVAEAHVSFANNIAELSLPRSFLGNPDSIRVAFAGDSSAYDGAGIDDYPNGQNNENASERFFEYYFRGGTPQNNLPPVANSQNLSVSNATPLNITLTGSDPENARLIYRVVTQTRNGRLSGNAPNLRYTPNTGFSGNDTFTFVVSDGSNTSAIATININVDSSSENGFSNVVGNITIDGNISEWASLTGFPTDPNDISMNNQEVKNWRQVTAAHNNTQLYLRYENYGAVDPENNAGGFIDWGWQTFIDSDNNANTGYQIGNMGADIILEGTQLQRYLGNGSDWNWSSGTPIELRYNGTNVELAVPRNLLGNATILKFLFIGDNAANNGSTADEYPNNLNAITYRLSSERTSHVARRPEARNHQYNLPQDTSISFNLSGSDADNDKLSYRIVTSPANGVISNFNVDGTNISYTPNQGFSGTDTLRFIANDGALDSSVQTISFNVSSNNTSSGTEASGGGLLSLGNVLGLLFLALLRLNSYRRRSMLTR